MYSVGMILLTCLCKGDYDAAIRAKVAFEAGKFTAKDTGFAKDSKIESALDLVHRLLTLENQLDARSALVHPFINMDTVIKTGPDLDLSDKKALATFVYEQCCSVRQ